MSKTRITCGIRVRLAKFYIKNYTFHDNFLHLSQRIRYLGLNISIISEFQKNLSSSFLKCGGIPSLSQRYYPRIYPMRLSWGRQLNKTKQVKC